MSRKENPNPIVFIADLEPLYRDMLYEIRKVMDLEEYVPYLYDKHARRTLGYAPACFQQDNSGNLIPWDGASPPGCEIYNSRGKLIYSRNKPPEICFSKNIRVFNIALLVIDAMIENTRAFKKSAGACIIFDDVFKGIITPNTYRHSSEQSDYYQQRMLLADAVATDHLNQEKRERMVKFETMTVGEEQSIFKYQRERYDIETRYLIYRDDDTVEALTQLGDNMLIILRKMSNYDQLYQLLNNNEWGIFSTKLSARTGAPFSIQLQYRGDLRVLQWEKEHLHEYPNAANPIRR